jgi:hypothetical protein
MTFRLVNAGKKEIWHKDEFLYHVWHPGDGGYGNFAGPHDGHGMSKTALKLLKNGRIFPLVENPAIRILRTSEKKDPIIYFPYLLQAIPQRELKNYTTTKLNLREVRYDT